MEFRNFDKQVYQNLKPRLQPSDETVANYNKLIKEENDKKIVSHLDSVLADMSDSDSSFDGDAVVAKLIEKEHSLLPEFIKKNSSWKNGSLRRKDATIVLLGKTGVGKSSLANAFLLGEDN